MLDHAAYRSGLAVAGANGRDDQRALGQYMTPPPIARAMAERLLRGLLPVPAPQTLRVLEPAAGSGVLLAALVQALCALGADRPRRVEVLAYEIDARLMPALRATCDACVESAAGHGIELRFVLAAEDFLLSALARAQWPVADVVIANPPYGKLNAGDERARAHPDALYGQPNLYGLFMSATAALLRPGGRWCFITPRSWMTGPYFRAVRAKVLRHLGIDAIHAFESRTGHFEDDSVLQEAVITWAIAGAPSPGIEFSRSAGAEDLCLSPATRLSEGSLLRGGVDRRIVLPQRAEPEVEPWPETLGSLGLKVSTGPTVAFRNRAHVRHGPTLRTVPLLWMKHVQRMQVSWPADHEHEHIEANAATAWMLLPNQALVVMRRFSPKEDVRRMTAAAYLGGLPGRFLGLENHLNYVHRPGGSLSEREAAGVAAVLNSARVDRYLRSHSGNTQINAADLREMPLPGWGRIAAIGARVETGGLTLTEIDAAVDDATETRSDLLAA